MILCMPKLFKKGKDTHERQIMAYWPYGSHRRIYVVRWHTRRPQTTSMEIIRYLFSYYRGLGIKTIPSSYYSIIRCCYIFYFIEQYKRRIGWLQQYSIMVDLRSFRFIRCIW